MKTAKKDFAEQLRESQKGKICEFKSSQALFYGRAKLSFGESVKQKSV